MQSKGPPSILLTILTDQECGRVIPYNDTISVQLYVQYWAQFLDGPSSRLLFVQSLFFEPQMNLNKKKLFPKVVWFLVFHPAEFWVYSYYILWARRGDAKVGEFGFPENVFDYGYSNYMVYFTFLSV